MDFKEVREKVSLEATAKFLGIELKKDGNKFRCHCPACDKPRVLVITPGKGWYCHNVRKGGDVTDLAAHVKGIKQVEALKLLADAFLRVPEPAKPTRKRRSKPTPTVHQPAGGTELDQWEAFISRL